MASVTSTNSTTAPTATSDALSSAASSNGMGKDAFLKLLVAQISHQDPLQPMDNTAFVSQLAQFSALEQQQGTNSRLDALTAQETGVANTEASSLVGKNVTVSGNTLALGTDGTGAPVGFTLAAPASTCTVSITDSSGNTVRTLKLGAEPMGKVSIQWDGKNDSGVSQPAGAYKINVSAANQAGNAVQVSQQTTGLLTSVSFANGYTQLVLADGTTAAASDLISVNQAPTATK